MPGYLRRSIIGVAGAVLISKVLGFLREMVIADKFGTSAEYDLYLIGIMLPALFYGIINYAGFYFLVPYFTKVLKSNDTRHEIKSMHSVWPIINFNLLVAVTITILVIVSAPYVMRFWTAGFSEQAFDRVVFFSRIMASIVALGIIEAIFRAFLNVKGIFTYPAASYIVFNVVSISAILLFHSQYSVLSIAIGSIGGLLLQNLYLFARVLGFNPFAGFQAALYNDDIRAVMSGATVLLLIELINRSYFMIDRYFASDFGEGIISAINYSYVLVSLPDAVIGFAIGSVLFPKFSESASDLDDSRFVTLYRKAILASVMMAVPLSVLFFVSAPEIILLAFHRGSFDINSVQTTVSALRPFTPSIIALFLVSTSIRACYSRDWGKYVLGYASILFVVKLAGTAFLPELVGFPGITAATSLAHVGFAALMLARLVGKTEADEKLVFLFSLGKMVLAGLAALAVAFFAAGHYDQDWLASPHASAALRLGLSVLIIGTVYILAAVMLGMKQQMTGLLQQLFRRS